MNIKEEPSWNCAFLSDENDSEDEIFIYLMELWGLKCMIDDWKSRYIDLECLKLMTEEDVNILLPVEKLGLRIKFKRKLKIWRMENGHPDPNLELPLPTFNTNVDPLEIPPLVPVVSSCPINRRKRSQAVIGVDPVGEEALSGHSTDTDHIVVHHGRKITKLDHILQSSQKGLDVIQYFNDNDFKLDNSSRNSLISTIIDYHVRMSEGGMSAVHFDFYALEITKTFPNESYETYYTGATPTNKAGGKLINKYYSVSKTLKLGLKRGKPIGHSNAKKPKIVEAKRSVAPQIPTDLKDFSKEQIWLMKNTGPWNEIIENWTDSFSSRKNQFLNNFKTVEQILSNWPVLSDEKSHQLINMDFGQIHPDKNHFLYQKWENFTIKLTNYYTSAAHIKDPEYRKLMDSLKTSITENAKNCILAVCLAYIPLARIKMKTDKFLATASIEEIKNSFISIVESPAQFEEKCKSFKAMCQKKGFKVHPLIIVIKNEITEIDEYVVYFDGLRYTFNNFAQALDMCFKIHHVFYIEYSTESYWIWRFLQSYFYEIESNDVRSCVLSSFISDFL